MNEEQNWYKFPLIYQFSVVLDANKLHNKILLSMKEKFKYLPKLTIMNINLFFV